MEEGCRSERGVRALVGWAVERDDRPLVGLEEAAHRSMHEVEAWEEVEEYPLVGWAEEGLVHHEKHAERAWEEEDG